MIPKEAADAWESKKGPVVFTTVSEDGIPNSIYVGMYKMLDGNRLAIANNYFCKTLANIKNGSQGAVLFITEQRESYQLKGSLEYTEDGPVFEDMKNWNRSDLPGIGTVVMSVKEAYKGAEKLL